ncbi:MAG: nuclear transport factor 2 family protein, partial [Balneolaceae bacterium]|nr:nuclear transport factor 2 family protein [Balneolaceae bacterium]
TWLTAYLNADVETYDAYFDDDYHFIGSTSNEEFLNRNDATTFFEQTGEQFAGIMDLRNEIKILEIFDTSIFITHFCDVWFINDKDRTYYGRFRLSSIMQKNNENWRFIYQHFSMPDSKSEEGESIGFDKINAENFELKEAIKRRTIELESKNRELEIEAALARVRTQSMAMQHPDDLDKVNKELLTQLQKLQIDGLSGVSIWLIDDEGLVTAWDLSSPGNLGDPNSAMVRYDPNKFDILGEPWRMLQNSNDDYFVIDYSAEKLQKAIKEWAQVDQEVAEGFRNALSNGSLKHQWNPIARHTHGILSIDLVKPPADDTKEIVTKMAGAFSLAYRRFLDLQKAEAQAREAQIEASLERVRSRSIAMQKSDELNDVAFVLYEQLQNLGGEMWGTGFVFCHENKDEDIAWFANEKGILPPVSVPNTHDPAHVAMFESWKNNKDFVSIIKSGKDLEDHYDYMMSLPQVRPFFQQILDSGLHFPTWQQWNAAYFTHGYLLIITLEPYPEPDILKRFARVFDQTYTRFLDLQKAEAQAREAQIEAALERVRSRTMAMQSSDELQEASFLLDQQVRELGIKTWGCAFNIYRENDSIEWFGNEKGVLPTYTIPREGIFQEYYDYGQQGKSIHVQEFSGEKCIAHYEYMSTLPVIGEVLLQLKETNGSFPEYQIDHVIYFKYGYLLFITTESVSEETHDIFKRFANVFEQTYTRFLDLQKAESQAREARIEAALERVRSRTMGMQNSSELGEVAAELFAQMNNLVSDLWTCGFVLCEKGRDEDEWWLSMDGDFTRGFFLPNVDDYAHASLYEGWLKGEDFRVVQLEGDILQQHYDWLMDIPVSRAIFEEMDAAGIARPDWQKLHAAYFSKGYLVLITREPCDEEEIFKRFASVFDLTYTRFLDLKKAEAQAREAQIEASLERVRAKAMSMQNSDELDEVLSVLCEQFDVLGIYPMSTHMTVFNFDNNTFTFRETGKYGDRSFGEQTVDLDAMDTWKDTVDKWKADKATAVNRLHFPKETLPEVWEVFHESFASMPEESRITPDDYPDGIYHTAGKHPFGYIGMNQVRPATEEEEQIVIKFANEFGRAYQRFLDLQKAEAQAREANIETALEKVRSRSMGMQSSEELPEVANLMFLEIQALGINAWSCGYCILEEDRRSSICIMSSEGTIQKPFLLPHIGEPSFEEWDDFVHSDKNFFVQELKEEAIESHYDFMTSLPQLKPIFQDLKDAGLTLPTYQINHLS